MAAGFKRRNYFINKELQGKYIFNYFLLIAIGSIIFSIIFSFFSSNSLTIVYDDYHLQLGSTPGILLNKILSTQWLLIVVGGLATVIFTLFLTHRVAGPFFRFQKCLDFMMDRDLSDKIFLRQKDEGQKLAKQINSFNSMLSSDLDEIKKHTEQINHYCHNIGYIINESENSQGNILPELNKIIQLNQQTRNLVDEFNLLKE